MASLDSSGAIGGVLELPGDDYFIYGGGEVQVKCCVPVHHSTQGIVGSSWIYRLSAQHPALACLLFWTRSRVCRNARERFVSFLV